jgi:hypothetical protein
VCWFIYFLSILSVGDPVSAGLNEVRNAERQLFFTLPPDSDRNGKHFYENPVQLVNQKCRILPEGASAKFIERRNFKRVSNARPPASFVRRKLEQRCSAFQKTRPARHFAWRASNQQRALARIALEPS